MSTKSGLDLRVKRTRRALHEALLQLMQEKPFREIQITEIADRAQVARPTFYLHYQSKQELLLSHVDEVFEAFYGELTDTIAAQPTDQQQYRVMLFQYWERYADTLRMVIAADLHKEFRARLHCYFSRAITQFAPAGFKVDEQRLVFIVDFVAGGADALLTEWILRDKPYSAEQMGALFHELTADYERVLFAQE